MSSLLWPHPQFEPKIVLIRNSRTSLSSWHCLVKQLPDGDFRSLEGPSPPAHASPNDALAAASARVADLLSARQEAIAVEVVRLLQAGRLRPAPPPDTPLPNTPLDPLSTTFSDPAIIPSMAPFSSPSSSVASAPMASTTSATAAIAPLVPLEWIAQREDGTWTEPNSTPQAATREALNRPKGQ